MSGLRVKGRREGGGVRGKEEREELEKIGVQKKKRSRSEGRNIEGKTAANFVVDRLADGHRLMAAGSLFGILHRLAKPA